MPQDGRIQTATFSYEGATGYNSMPIEFGSRGEACELLGVHYHCLGLRTDQDSSFITALSSNPDFEVTPPVAIGEIMAGKSTYGLLCIVQDFYQATADGLAMGEAVLTWIIPLYGLIRPRRQMWVWSISANITMPLVCEIYYRPVTLQDDEMDLLNRKYGLYRRT